MPHQDDNYNAKSLNVAQKVASKNPWHFSSQYEGFIWVNIISIINPDTFSQTSTPTFLCLPVSSICLEYGQLVFRVFVHHRALLITRWNFCWLR